MALDEFSVLDRYSVESYASPCPHDSGGVEEKWGVECGQYRFIFWAFSSSVGVQEGVSVWDGDFPPHDKPTAIYYLSWIGRRKVLARRIIKELEFVKEHSR